MPNAQQCSWRSITICEYAVARRYRSRSNMNFPKTSNGFDLASRQVPHAAGSSMKSVFPSGNGDNPPSEDRSPQSSATVSTSGSSA